MEEIGQLVVGLEQLVRAYGAAAVLVIVMLEAFGVPLPGELLLIFSAALAGRGEMSLPALLICAWAGAVIGDNIGYVIGRTLGRAAVARYRRQDRPHRGALRLDRRAVRALRRLDRDVRTLLQRPAPAQRDRGGDAGNELVAFPHLQRCRRRALGPDLDARRVLSQPARVDPRQGGAAYRGRGRTCGGNRHRRCALRLVAVAACQPTAVNAA